MKPLTLLLQTPDHITARPERIRATPHTAITMDITTPTLPTIHLNGTGADSIEREYRAVRRAIAAAADALQAATCNQRDFYPQERCNWDKAKNERAEAFRLLQIVSDYAEHWEMQAAEYRWRK